MLRQQRAVRSLAIREAALGADHLDVGDSLNQLALLHQVRGQFADAEPLYKRALWIFEKNLPDSHPRIAQVLEHLSTLAFARKDWSGALAYQRRPTAILIKRHARNPSGRILGTDNELKQATAYFRLHVLTSYRAGINDPALLAESYEVAQWSERPGAAVAILQMAARPGKGEGPLSNLVREHQDLEAQLAAADTRLSAALGRADPALAEEIRHQTAYLEGRWSDAVRQNHGDTLQAQQRLIRD